MISAASAASIREALAAADFIGARALWEEYSAALRATFAEGAPEESLNEVRDLLEAARLSLGNFRTHAADRIRRHLAARRYTQASGPQR